MRKIYFLICCLFCCLIIISPFSCTKTSYCQNQNEINYRIYKDDTFLFERPMVEVGDIIITKDFTSYEIYLVDQTNFTAKARIVENIEKPKITKKSIGSVSVSDKKISLYMTHNDESYLIGDGTDSYYGAGGIHDITQRLAYCFKQKGVHITVDETLHIPHNSSAYSRSKLTAQKLLKDNPNALFDIHRDGVSRSAYATKVDGEEKCQVRIVVGQANPNKAKNLEFAKYLMSVAEVVCPWLFCDIYYASGNYNQNLYEKALLFEMGTYTIEKELVMQTVPHLVDVVCTTLFQTTIDENGELVIGDLNSENQTIDNYLQSEQSTPANYGLILLLVAVFAIALIFVIWFFIRQKQKVSLIN